MINRRDFLKLSAGAAAGFFIPIRLNGVAKRFFFVPARQDQEILDPLSITKWADPLVIPPAMPRTSEITLPGGAAADYYEIGMRQFEQHILPESLPATTVWSYGSENHPGTLNYPSFTIEAEVDKPVVVKWINGLVDENGSYLPHLLPVDPTLHWANPPGPRDMEPGANTPYDGPVPMVVHVHGAHTHQESDGYPEAWYLPAANNIPDGYFTEGSFYNPFKEEFEARWGISWDPGSAVFHYPNDMRASTTWFHDHVLGITRLNVYTGPAGFYLLRGGSDDLQEGLPGPAPAQGDLPGTPYYEIPIAIQDRTFYDDGSLFYPDNRAFFEDLTPEKLQIPFKPDPACSDLKSDVPPIWNPEFFGNTIVVNGKTWPYLEVEPRRYRFRLLNGCNSRFLILKLEDDHPMWVIGNEGGFLPQPTEVTELVMSPAERYDVIVDFSQYNVGDKLHLINLGPDEPFGGGTPGVDFAIADPNTTGLVLELQVVALVGEDNSIDPANLVLPAITPLGEANNVRPLSLVELDSHSVKVEDDEAGNIILACNDPDAEFFGPVEAHLGIITPSDQVVDLGWDEPITETPSLDDIEIWEFYNLTMDAHPIHVHLVHFEVVNRQDLLMEGEEVVLPPQPTGSPLAPEPTEEGFKDTVIAYPGQVTRIKAKFDIPGLFVWHCHILEHEDNEMMRPYQVVRKIYFPLISQGEAP